MFISKALLGIRGMAGFANTGRFLSAFNKEAKIVLLLVTLFFLYLNFGGSTQREIYIINTHQQANAPAGAVIDDNLNPKKEPKGSAINLSLEVGYMLPNGSAIQVIDYYEKKLKSMGWGKTVYIKKGDTSNSYYWCSKNLHEGKNVMAVLFLPHKQQANDLQVFTFRIAWYAWIRRDSVDHGNLCG